MSMKKSLFRTLISTKESIVTNATTISQSNGNVTVNGKTYKGKSVVVRNNKVIIDGKQVDDKDLPETVLAIEVKGDLVSLETDASVNCENIKGDVDAGGSVNCGSVGGDVDAGRSDNCGLVGVDVDAAGYGGS